MVAPLEALLKLHPDAARAHLELGCVLLSIDRLNEAGVPCGQIYSIDQVFSDPQVRHLKPQATPESPHVGKLTLLRQPMSLSRTPSRMELYPPAVGEHTEEILREAGFAPDEIAELARERII